MVLLAPTHTVCCVIRCAHCCAGRASVSFFLRANLSLAASAAAAAATASVRPRLYLGFRRVEHETSFAVRQQRQQQQQQKAASASRWSGSYSGRKPAHFLVQTRKAFALHAKVRSHGRSWCSAVFFRLQRRRLLHKPQQTLRLLWGSGNTLV